MVIPPRLPNEAHFLAQASSAYFSGAERDHLSHSASIAADDSRASGGGGGKAASQATMMAWS